MSRRSRRVEDVAQALIGCVVVMYRGSGKGMGAGCRGDVPEATVRLPTIDHYLSWGEGKAH
jgi:hypothetical protein